MTLAQHLTRYIDFFYIRPIRAVLPLQTFRYAVCGGLNLGLNWVLYAVLYNFILDKKIVDLGVVAVSPYIAAFLIVFPITFLPASGHKNISLSKVTTPRTNSTVPLYDQCGGVDCAELHLPEIFCRSTGNLSYPFPGDHFADYDRLQLFDAKTFYFSGCQE